MKEAQKRRLFKNLRKCTPNELRIKYSLIIYLFRWQLSTLILYPCVNYLPFNNFWNVIISNFIGGLIFFPVDKFILNKKRDLK